MLNSNTILSVLKDAVDSSISSTGGLKDKSERFKTNVINKFAAGMKKTDKNIKVYSSRDIDINDGYLLIPIDDNRYYENGLPFLTQLVLFENGQVKLKAVYSSFDGKALYTFNSNEIFIKDKNISIRFIKPTEQRNLICVENIANQYMMEYVNNIVSGEMIVSYYSYGVMLFKLILGELKECYAYGLDWNELSEILWLCSCAGVDIKAINGIYRFTRNK